MKRIVGGALFNKGKLLVLKRINTSVWPNLWEIPGGKAEKDENDEEALKREFFEETRIKIKIVQKYYQYEYIHDNGSATENDYIVQANIFEVIVNPEEHNQYKWISTDEIKNLEMSSKMKKSVKEAFKVMGT